MEPLKTFDDVATRILERKPGGTSVVIGILIADWRQTEAREYILNYMNMFDEESGKFIDFFIPGYFTNSDRDGISLTKRYHPLSSDVPQGFSRMEKAFTIEREGIDYYFHGSLFEDTVEAIEDKLKIEYTFNPMLILVEVWNNLLCNEIKYGEHLVIELDEDSNRGLRRSGQLFKAIFEIAKKRTGLYNVAEGVRIYYLKKGDLKKLIKELLDKKYIDFIDDGSSFVKRFRIRKAV